MGSCLLITTICAFHMHPIDTGTACSVEKWPGFYAVFAQSLSTGPMQFMHNLFQVREFE